MRGPIARTFRAVARVAVAAVLLAVWVVAMGFVQVLNDPLSRRPPPTLWWVILIGVPVAVLVRFLYRSHRRAAVAVALLAVWVLGVWVAAVVSSGGLTAHRGSMLWLVPMIGVPVVVFGRFLYRCRRRDGPGPPTES